MIGERPKAVRRATFGRLRFAETRGVPAKLVLLGLFEFAGIVACEAGAGRGDSATQRELVVFAASSLTDVFAEMAESFEATHPGVEVLCSFAGTHLLRLQIEQGAPADVFAAADSEHLAALARADLVAEPIEVFADNDLVVVVPAGNPARIADLADLVRTQRVVLGASAVPVGGYTDGMFERAGSVLGEATRDGILARVVSREPNVRLVLAKVELGEADAAVVYRTDAMSSSRVRLIELPEALRTRVEYQMGAVRSSSRVDLARRWIAFVASGAGQRILRRHGFRGTREDVP